MTPRQQIIEENRVSYYLDDSLNIVQPYEITDKVRLVCFQCGFEPLVVAVRSYLDTRIDEDEALEIAEDYLKEIGWLKHETETYVL
jgi:hypothetical protein